MSDRLAAEIFIGGDVPASAVPELRRAIANERLSLAWRDVEFEPETAADLMKAREESGGVLLLWLRHDDVRWGEFDGLEPVLQKHDIPFTRRTEGKGEYTAERVEFRPGMDSPICLFTHGNGDPVVSVSELLPVEAALAEAVEQLDAGDTGVARALAGRALHTLRTQIPPQLPPLDEIRITPEEDKKASNDQ